MRSPPMSTSCFRKTSKSTMLKSVSSKIQIRFKVTTDLSNFWDRHSNLSNCDAQLFSQRRQTCQTAQLGACTGCAMTVWIHERARKCQKKFEGTGSELFLFANLDLPAFYLRPWNRVNNFATMLCESGKGSGDSTTPKLCVFKHVNKTPSPMNRWIDESLSLNIVTYRHIVILCRSGDWCLRPSVRICTARTASTVSANWEFGLSRLSTENLIWNNLKQIWSFAVNLDVSIAQSFPAIFRFTAEILSWCNVLLAAEPVVQSSIMNSFLACNLRRASKRHSTWCDVLILTDIDVVWVQSNNQTARNFSAQQLSKTIRTYVLIYMLNLQFCVFSPASSFISFLSVAVAGDYVIQTSMSLIMPITCNSCQREQTTSGRVRESQTSLAWLQQQSSERHFKTPNCYTFYSQLSYHGLVWLGGLERGMMGTAWNSYVREFWKSKK